MRTLSKKRGGLILPLIFVLSVFPFTRGYAVGPGKTMEKVLSSLVPDQGELVFEHQAFTLPEKVKTGIEDEVKQEFLSDTVDFWEIHRGGQLVAYALMDDVLGKHSPFTFAVLYDTQGTITAVRVIHYRERYGSGIKNKKWLKQFIDKNASSSFELGKDIDAVSSSTISSASITLGIKKLTRLMAYIINQRAG